jgi:thiol:disulfide interchange protein
MRTRPGTVLLAAIVASAALAAPSRAQGGRPTAEVTPVVDADGVHPGRPVRVALSVTLPAGFHVQSDKPRDPALIPTVLSVEPPPGVTLARLIYPVPTDFAQAGQDQPLAVFEHEFVLGARLEVGAGVAPGSLVIPGRLRYQACDENVCFAPRTADVQWTVTVVPAATPVAARHPDVFKRLAAGRETDPPAAAAPVRRDGPDAPATDGSGLARLDRFEVQGTTGGYLGTGDFLQFISDAESGVKPRGLFEGRGPIAILLIVFLGGLALNLTPCVLPMIPINMAIIGAGAQAGTRRRGFLLGSTYGGAMALVYGILGLVVILTAGTFGTINASPWFNAGIAALFVVLGLAMFDVVPIDFSRFSSGMRAANNRGTFTLAFTMGAVAALLAGACVAPVVIQVVLFSSSLYAGGTTLALALPFCLGLGMALPWPLAGAGLAALPKPGMWMVRVKQALGLLILATAVYYGYLAYTLFANRWVDPSAVSGSVQAKLNAGWTDSLADGLAAAEREGKPVLLDFWATWCKNCLTMDKTTFEDPAVTAALANYVKIKIQAEDPDAEPAKGLMARFNAVGLPTYVVLRPAGGARPPGAVAEETGGRK